MKVRHNCGVDGWAICCSCCGRVHQLGCTSKPDWRKDCCPERHNQLADLEYFVGIHDNSQHMRGEYTIPMGNPLREYQNPTPGLPKGFPRPKETRK